MPAPATPADRCLQRLQTARAARLRTRTILKPAPRYWQRTLSIRLRSLALHASSISVDGRAVLFCGPSGTGKSSLAAALSAAGYRVIADDVSLVTMTSDGRPMVVPDGRRLKLWSDAIEGLAIGTEQEAVRPGIRKYWVDPPVLSGSEATPVAAIYFLRREMPPFKAGIETLRLLDSIEMLRVCAYRRKLVRLLGQEGAWFGKCTEMLTSARAFRFTRPWNLSAMPQCVERLESHWKSVFG